MMSVTNKSPQKISIKRILFVEPAGTYLAKSNGEVSRKHILPPLGPAMIAAVAERAGYEVQILDIPSEGFENEKLYKVDPWTGHKTYEYGLSNEEIIRRIEQFDPQVIGVSNAQAIRFEQTVHFCRLVKDKFPDKVVIVGGSNATVMYDEYLAENCADLIALGEGEDIILDILNCLEKKPEELAQIDGLVCNGYKGMQFVNPKTKWRSSIMDLPPYAWHLLPMSLYGAIADRQLVNTKIDYVSNNRFIAYFSSRGCPHSCTYCAIRLTWGHKFRYWDALKVVDEMQMISEKYGIKELHFLDSNFLANRQRATEICHELIKRRLDIQWCVPPGFEIHLLDPELMNTLRAAKCYAIYLPIESGNQEQLNYLSSRFRKTKSVNLNKVKEVISRGHDLGFYLSGYFMVGFPHETKDDMIRTTDFAASLGLDGSHFFVATPLKGTELYKQCMENGYLTYGWHSYRMRYSIGNIGTKEFDPSFTEEMRRTGWLKVMAASPKTKQSFEDMVVEPHQQIKAAVKLLSNSSS